MRRIALRVAFSLGSIAVGVAAFLYGHPLVTIGLVVVGWAVLGSTIQGGARMPPGEGPPPDGVGGHFGEPL